MDKEVINTTIFASFYDANGDLQEINMSEMELLLTTENNKATIAMWLYHRLYDRFLRPFFFDEDPIFKEYPTLVERYKKQYKHGFAIMTNCCLLIETLASLLTGNDQTKRKKAIPSYQLVLEKAENYNNPLKIFIAKELYEKIRCGLLHQAETYGNFAIRRNGTILHSDGKTINASEFAKALRSFLQSYKEELESEKWNNKLWINCRRKINYIIVNSTKKTKK